MGWLLKNLRHGLYPVLLLLRMLPEYVTIAAAGWVHRCLAQEDHRLV